MPNLPPQRAVKKRSILGIDLRAFSVKVAELEISAAGTVLKKWGIEDFSSPFSGVPLGQNPQLKALQSILEKNKIKTKNAAVCISGPEVVVKNIALPKLSRNETTEAIKLQLSAWVSFPADEAIFDFTLLGESGGQAHYLVAVAKKGIVSDTLSICKACGLGVEFITVISLALLNDFPIKAAEKGTATCLIYMGKHNTNVNIFKDGVFEFGREISLGGDFITTSMVGVILTENAKIELDYKKAEELKTKFGIPLDLDAYTQETGLPGVQVLAFMRPALEKIEAELLRSFSYYRSQSGNGEVAKIIITGGASKTINFIELMAGALGVPVERGVPAVLAEPDSKERLPDLAVAIGTALEEKEPRINLLPEEIKNQWGALLKKLLAPKVLVLSFVAIFFVVYAFVWSLGVVMESRLSQVESQVELLKPKAEKITLLEQKLQNLESGKAVLSVALAKHKQEAGLLKQVGQVIPDAAVLTDLRIKEEDDGTFSVELSGFVFSYQVPKEEVLAQFIRDLKQLPGLKQVLLDSALGDQSYSQPALNFSITCSVAGGIP
jgi:type IV pilus assembly protein PilM